MIQSDKGRPRLLDLFCGAGGAAMGYYRAGFDVVGVDIEPQPSYPFEFIQADALAIMDLFNKYGSAFVWSGSRSVGVINAIHASPPCQAYSAGAGMRKGYAKQHPRLIEPVRERLLRSRLPYVIENVEGAPLIDPVRLCGSSFGLAVRRHRLFESNRPVVGSQCQHQQQTVVVGVYGDHPEHALIRRGHPARRAYDIPDAQRSMGIDWMPTWAELKEAVPPAYTEWIGQRLIAAARQLVAA